MKIEQVLETYDETYAEAYNDAFLTDSHSQKKTADEILILSHLLSEKGGVVRWLDVACGTGYYLSHFPQTRRAGLDLSPAMLDIARRKSPGIPLIQGNFRDKSLVAEGSYDVISSMWWAYSFAESYSDIEALIDNLCDWLTGDGVCFMPICHPSKNLYADQFKLPYIVSEDAPAYGGRLLVTGVTWSWIQPNGKRHDNMLAPQMDYMMELFKKRFATVEFVEYSNGYYWGILAAKQPRDFKTLQSLFESAPEPRQTPDDPHPQSFVKRLFRRFTG